MNMAEKIFDDIKYTYQDVEKFLLKYAGLKPGDAAIRSKKEAKKIGEGKGFLSNIIKLDLEWDKPHSKLVNHVVLKVPSDVAMKAMMGSMEEFNAEEITEAMSGTMLPLFHRQECAFYRVFSDRAEDPPIPLPTVYYSEEMSSERQGIIVMEDFTQRSGVNIDMVEGYRLEQTFALVECIADLQAWSYNHRDDRIDKFRPLFDVENVFCPLFDPDNFGDIKSVLCHGDLWFNNLFFTQNPEGSVHETSERPLAFIDWQGVHAGYPTEDLCRVLVSSVPSSIRQRYWKTLLHHFYDRICSQVHPAPYTFDDLLVMYKRMFPAACLMFPFAIGFLVGPESPFMKLPNAEDIKREMIDRSWKDIADGAAFLDEGHLVSKSD